MAAMRRHRARVCQERAEFGRESGGRRRNGFEIEYALLQQRDGLKLRQSMGKRQKSFKPGQGYTKADWDAVQSPELTDEQMAKAKPFAEALPDFAASIRDVS